MQDPTRSLAWHQIRLFLAIARAGSLGGAASALDTTQPSVSRDLRALEDTLGYALFVRHARGVRPTQEGAALLAAADRVDLAVQGFERAARASQEAAGTLRIAATEYIGVEVLAPQLDVLRASHPRLAVELVLDNTPSDLTRGDADIAVRLFRPTQPELIARRVAQVPTSLYASRSYLERRGAPADLDALTSHDLIGFDGRGPLANAMAQLDARLTPDAFAIRTDSLMAQLAACRGGAGISVQQQPIARRYPELVPLLPNLALPPLDLWLVAHEDMRQSAVIRAGFTWIEAALTRYAGS